MTSIGGIAIETSVDLGLKHLLAKFHAYRSKTVETVLNT